MTSQNRCPAKVKVSESVQKELITKAKKTMMDDKWVDEPITAFEVIGWFSDADKQDRDTIVHATLIVYTEKYNQTFNWGLAGEPVKDEMEQYSYPKQSWFGSLIGESDDVGDISMMDIYANATAWIEFYGKGGSYPQNCRGYVDFALRNLFCCQIKWGKWSKKTPKPLRIEPIQQCLPDPLRGEKLIELK